MRIIIRNNMNSVPIMNSGILLVLSVAYIAASGILMFTYDLWYIRYPIVIVGLLIVFLKRNTFTKLLKEIRK